MMTEDTSLSPMPRWVRKLLIPALIGAASGAGASAGMMYFIDSPAVGGLGVSATIAAVVGAMYVVIGASITFGTVNPQLGAKFLNVEDADELREQKKMLALSGVAMLLWGVALVALALAAPDGPVPQSTALAIGLGGLVIGSAMSVLIYRECDELMLAVNLEGGALSSGLVFLVVGSWAVCAHLGYTAAPTPLDLLTLFYVLLLVASFIAVGRRGMLAIR